MIVLCGGIKFVAIRSFAEFSLWTYLVDKIVKYHGYPKFMSVIGMVSRKYKTTYKMIIVRNATVTC